MKKLFFIIILLLFGGVFFIEEKTHQFEKINAESDTAMQEEIVEYTPPEEEAQGTAFATTTPPQMSPPVDTSQSMWLKVPFQPQAPFGDWSQPWQDACEEASLVLANRFAHGTKTLTREEMRDEILKLVAFQNERYGDYKDSDAAQTAEIGRTVYGLHAEVKEVATVKEVKEVLREGKLIIAPMAGRSLHNPYFTPPGPLYHMIVVIGIDESTGEFITNDVGTRRGEAFRYAFATLWDALHDFPGEKERIEEEKKKIIIVSR